MDSGNSSSMQSSSGGDEEYDSRPEPISAFFNPSGSLSSLSHYPPLHSPSIDPLFMYLDAIARSLPPSYNSNAFLNLDVSSCTATPNLMGSPPPPPSTAAPITPSPPPPTPPLPQSQRSTSAPLLAAASRSSKKRSRTTRRELTTVLTTDTSNFRAMVQEFTGLPALPFSSSFPRSRFPAASPLSLLRPFTVSSSSSSSSSHFPNFLASASVDSASSAANTFSSTDKTPPMVNNNTINNTNLLNMFNLQSYLQSSPATSYGGLSFPVPGGGRAPQETLATAPMATAVNLGQPMEVPQSRGGNGADSELLRWIGGPGGSSEYRAEKASDNVPAGGKGTVDSWIFSSTERRV